MKRTGLLDAWMNGFMKKQKVPAGGECVADADAYNARAIYWLPVERELPDADITVLVYIPSDDETIFMGYLDGDCWRSVSGEQIEVTHLADLPAPPLPAEVRLSIHYPFIQ